MLSMKTLRVAIVTMGSALLLGPGMAAARPTTNLDALSPAATMIAAETLADSMGTTTRHGVSGAKYFNVDGPDDMDVTFRPRLRLDLDDEYHLRVELDGMIFRAAPALQVATGTPADPTADPPTPYVAPDSAAYAAIGNA